MSFNLKSKIQELQEIAKSVVDVSNNSLILTFSNWAFKDLAENFLFTVSDVGRIQNVLFVSLDNQTHQHFKSKVTSFLFEKPNANYDSDAKSFGTLDFKSICHEKGILLNCVCVCEWSVCNNQSFCL
jgi:hypothetical protein